VFSKHAITSGLVLPSSAKPQLDGLVLFSVHQANHPHPHHPHNHPGKFISKNFSLNVDQVSSGVGDLNSLANGIFDKMEDALNFWTKWKTTSILFARWKMCSIFWQNGRRPKYFGKKEDDLNFKVNGRQPKF
jgi:hypothetical protein